MFALNKATHSAASHTSARCPLAAHICSSTSTRRTSSHSLHHPRMQTQRIARHRCQATQEEIDREVEAMKQAATTPPSPLENEGTSVALKVAVVSVFVALSIGLAKLGEPIIQETFSRFPMNSAQREDVELIEEME